MSLLCQKLAAIPEGAGTLLDNSVGGFGSGQIEESDWKNLRVLYAGRGGGLLKVDQFVPFASTQSLERLPDLLAERCSARTIAASATARASSRRSSSERGARGASSQASEAQSAFEQIAASEAASGVPGSGAKPYSQRVSGGSDMRIDSTRPSVRRPKTVPRS